MPSGPLEAQGRQEPSGIGAEFKRNRLCQYNFFNRRPSPTSGGFPRSKIFGADLFLGWAWHRLSFSTPFVGLHKIGSTDWFLILDVYNIWTCYKRRKRPKKIKLKRVFEYKGSTSFPPVCWLSFHHWLLDTSRLWLKGAYTQYFENGLHLCQTTCGRKTF